VARAHISRAARAHLSVSCTLSNDGATLTNINTLAVPPCVPASPHADTRAHLRTSEVDSRCVSFELRYGMCSAMQSIKVASYTNSERTLFARERADHIAEC
jgi:hypothetical protein